MIGGKATKDGTWFHKPMGDDPPFYVSAALPWGGGDSQLSWQYHVWRDEANGWCKYGRRLTNPDDESVTVREYVYAYTAGGRTRSWAGDSVGAGTAYGPRPVSFGKGDPPFYLVTIKPSSKGDRKLAWQYHAWRDEEGTCHYGSWLKNLSSRDLTVDIYMIEIQ